MKRDRVKKRGKESFGTRTTSHLPSTNFLTVDNVWACLWRIYFASYYYLCPRCLDANYPLKVKIKKFLGKILDVERNLTDLLRTVHKLLSVEKPTYYCHRHSRRPAYLPGLGKSLLLWGSDCSEQAMWYPLRPCSADKVKNKCRNARRTRVGGPQAVESGLADG